jgi:ectoine hydroxylase-related dioxygenase (phytanoyl-CoA dioxygenase family)
MILLLLIIFIFYLIFIFEQDEEIYNNESNLETDGFLVIKKMLDDNQIEKILNNSNNNNYDNIKELLLNDKNILENLQKYTNNNYFLQNYIWIIKKSLVHTCHRDYNGTFYNSKQKHPSYTLIIFIEDMEKCLGIIPKSHISIDLNNINLINNVKYLLCNKGDAILFNANLIHVGAINEKENNLRVQLKLTHKDDLEILNYYENYNKVLNKSNKINKNIIKIQKNISCMFPFISDLVINKANNKINKISIGKKIFSLFFHGDSQFYN